MLLLFGQEQEQVTGDTNNNHNVITRTVWWFSLSTIYLSRLLLPQVSPIFYWNTSTHDMFLLHPVIQFLCRKGSSGSEKAAQPKNPLVKKPTSAVLLFVGRCSHVVRYVRVWSWENFSHLHNQAPVSIFYEVHASFREMFSRWTGSFFRCVLQQMKRSIWMMNNFHEKHIID